MKSILSEKWLKIPVFILCLAPLGRLVWRGLQHRLGANPIELITHETGDWTLIFLVITLCISPARKLIGQPLLIRFRRMLGLFAFFYGCLHFTTYIWLDKFFDWSEMLADVAKRRFITVGMTGFVLMIPLAATSTAGWIRRLGGRRWQALHRLSYVSAAAGVVHYYWLVKSDVRKPVAYGTLVALLLAWRLWYWLRAKNSRMPVSSDSFKNVLRQAPRLYRKHRSEGGPTRSSRL
jgi:sulfoxide reductase heme-binding subunit YedZ